MGPALPTLENAECGVWEVSPPRPFPITGGARRPRAPPVGGTARGAHTATPSGGAERRDEKRALIGEDTPGGDESGTLIGHQHPKVGVKTWA